MQNNEVVKLIGLIVPGANYQVTIFYLFSLVVLQVPFSVRFSLPELVSFWLYQFWECLPWGE